MGKQESWQPDERENRATDDNPGPDRIILPDGSRLEETGVSDRSRQRSSEDAEYLPVVIKRTDETRRHPDDALENAIEEGLEQLNRPAISLGLSAIAAGLILGFSAMAVAVVLTAWHDRGAVDMVSRVSAALVYPLGFVVCILSGAQLFTEHTATALYPVLDCKANVRQLLRLWLIVIAGNLVGAAICALLLFLAEEVVHARTGYLELGRHLVGFSTVSLFVSAILAGWLMALGAWLAVTSPRTISQITVIYIVTFLIGIGGFHHSIAGSVEMFTAMLMSSEFTGPQAVRFILTALLGNLVGGSCLVALLNYGHIRRTR